jgi:hypothetical protein
MRIKIGNEWHEATAEKPVMVELSEDDKWNIAHMAPEATKYATFTDDDKRSKDEKLAWME